MSFMDDVLVQRPCCNNAKLPALALVARSLHRSIEKGRTHAELCAAVLAGRADRWSSRHVWRGGRRDADRLGALSDRHRAVADSLHLRTTDADAVALFAPTQSPSRVTRDGDVNVRIGAKPSRGVFDTRVLALLRQADELFRLTGLLPCPLNESRSTNLASRLEFSSSRSEQWRVADWFVHN